MMEVAEATAVDRNRNNHCISNDNGCTENHTAEAAAVDGGVGGGHQPIQCLPAWTYRPPHPSDKPHFDPLQHPDIDSIDLGGYVRQQVTNLESTGRSRDYFDVGLRLMLSYQHELAARCFMACLETSRYCALAHGLVALCHAPNYNFKGEAYYESAHHPEEERLHDLLCVFPSQQVADRHSKRAVDLIDEIRKLNGQNSGTSHRGGGGGGKKKGKSKHNKRSRNNNNHHNNNQNNANHHNNSADDTSMQQQEQQQQESNGSSSSTAPTTTTTPKLISDVETQLLLAIRILTSHPGLEHTLSDDIVGKYNDACVLKRCTIVVIAQVIKI
jgi:hypothetical protein